MTYEELVEKVARKLAQHDTHDPDMSYGNDPPIWTAYVVPVRAAIAIIYDALRDPIPEMVTAGVDHRMKTTIASWPADTAKLFEVILAASPLVKKDSDNG